jgi:shikimate 5-dehydrogenase
MTPATKPTFYFIGITTGKSSIMQVFPEWARHLGLGDVKIKGIDLRPHDTVENYRSVVNLLKSDSLSRGALVTPHKLDLLAAARDLFDAVDPHAQLTEETSCLSKRGGRLICHAKDPISSGLALDGFLPPGHFTTGAEVFSMGAVGSTITLTCHLMKASRGANRPRRIVVSNRSQARLDPIRAIHEPRHRDRLRLCPCPAA